MEDIKVVANGITMVVSTDEDIITMKPITDIENWQLYSFKILKHKFTASYLIQKIDEISKNFASMSNND